MEPRALRKLEANALSLSYIPSTPNPSFRSGNLHPKPAAPTAPDPHAGEPPVSPSPGSTRSSQGTVLWTLGALFTAATCVDVEEVGGAVTKVGQDTLALLRGPQEGPP